MGTSRGKKDEITLKLCSFHSAQLGFPLFWWVRCTERQEMWHSKNGMAPLCSHSLGEKPNPTAQLLL